MDYYKLWGGTDYYLVRSDPETIEGGSYTPGQGWDENHHYAELVEYTGEGEHITESEAMTIITRLEAELKAPAAA
jgi:hypothetical protein